MSVLRKPSLRQLAVAVAAGPVRRRRRGRSGQEGNRLWRHRRSLQRPDQAGHQAHPGKAGLHGARGRVQRLCAAQLRAGAGRAGRQCVPARGLSEELRGQEQAGVVGAGEGADRADRHLQPEIQERGRRARGRERGRANDPTNQARALVVLQELGWIKLREGYDPLQVSEKDVAANPKKIKLIPLEAAQLPRSLEDTDYSFVNGNFALASGLKLTEALALEKTTPTYQNRWRCARPICPGPMCRTSRRPTARASSGRDREILRRLRQDRRPAQAGGVPLRPRGRARAGSGIGRLPSCSSTPTSSSCCGTDGPARTGPEGGADARAAQAEPGPTPPLGVTLRKLGKRYGERVVLRGLDRSWPPASSWRWSAQRLRQEHAAPAGGLEAPSGEQGGPPARAGAVRRVSAVGRRRPGPHHVPDARLLPWKSVLDNVALGLPRRERAQAAAVLRQSVWATGAATGRRSCRAGSVSGSRWRGRWCTGRACCCWTSRWARWTRSRASTCSS